MPLPSLVTAGGSGGEDKEYVSYIQLKHPYKPNYTRTYNNYEAVRTSHIKSPLHASGHLTSQSNVLNQIMFYF